MKMFQGSTEVPGRCIVDCVLDTSFTKIPRLTAMNMFAHGYTGAWTNMKVIKTRVRSGKIRVVLEDDRWLLAKTVMSKNFNDRDASGSVKTDTSKTLCMSPVPPIPCLQHY